MPDYTGTSSYPSALDALDTVKNNPDPIGQDLVNARKAINAIEAELGTNPRGTAASVKDRLAAAVSVFNVKAAPYSAAGDGTTDDTAAIQAAIDAAGEGGIVYFPVGTYMISSPLEVKRLRRLRGVQYGGWNVRSETTRPCEIKAKTGFTGTAMLRIRTKTETGASLDNYGGVIENLGINGNGIAGGIHGILFRGKSEDWRIDNCEVWSCTGAGIRCEPYLTEPPSLLSMFRTFCRDNTEAGFSSSYFADGNFVHCQMNSNDGGPGWLFANGGSNILTACRAEWNATDGFKFTGSADRTALIGCVTDRNEQNGIHIFECVGNRPILISGCVTARDGANGNAGGGGYAGIKIDSTAALGTTPVQITGLIQAAGRNDDGTGTYSPENGVWVDYVTYAYIDGFLWGVTNALNNAGVSTIRTGAGTQFTTGNPGAQVSSRPTTIDASGDIRGRAVLYDRTSLQKTDGNSYHEMKEQTLTPAAPGADTVRLFAEDNGAGKTRIVARFNTGASVVIATQP